MDADLVRALTGKTLRAEAGRVHGFRRLQKPGCYPYIVSSASDCVDGLLLYEVDDDALQALDRYEAEGDLYIRVRVIAVTDHGAFPCETYVGNAAAIDGLEIS